jgi:hypothetical protein
VHVQQQNQALASSSCLPDQSSAVSLCNAIYPSEAKEVRNCIQQQQTLLQEKELPTKLDMQAMIHNETHISPVSRRRAARE